MIFVFGGGFTSGERNAEIYIPYYEFLAGHGIDVVAIDYRLGLENIDPEKATNIRA